MSGPNRVQRVVHRSDQGRLGRVGSAIRSVGRDRVARRIPRSPAYDLHFLR